MKDLVLCDLDHVLCDSYWRNAMIGGPGGWDAYHQAGRDDKPITAMVHLVRALIQYDFQVWGITARSEKWRGMTSNWLIQHNCFLPHVLMRADDDFRPSPRVKLDLARPHLYRVVFVIDDRDDVCAAFRAEGVVVLQALTAKVPAPSIPLELENAEGKH